LPRLAASGTLPAVAGVPSGRARRPSASPEDQRSVGVTRTAPLARPAVTAARAIASASADLPDPAGPVSTTWRPAASAAATDA
jgi:hypothetical protein